MYEILSRLSFIAAFVSYCLGMLGKITDGFSLAAFFMAQALYLDLQGAKERKNG